MISRAYRSDIQVLRGLAVFLVVLYHAACPIFPSGFVGVDIFFVISGFLMAAALPDLNFPSILTYYARRARRILPAYFTIIFIVWAAAVIIALPFETQQYSSQMLFYLTGLPNVSFWMDNTYFAPQLFRPGLHYWSLGVELQFYTLLPIIVFLNRKNRFFTFAILSIALIGSLLVTGISAKTAFFLTPFRIWEFLAGFVVAGWRPAPVSFKKIPFVGIAALIAFAALPIPVKQFPGFYVLPPVFLTAFLLYTGFQGQNLFYRIFEKAGEYSYSIYLVHYPLLVFMFYQPFATRNYVEFFSWRMGFALILTGVSSFFLYHGIEKPFRRKIISRKKLLLILSLIGGVGLAAMIGGPDLSALKYSPQSAKIFDAFFDHDVYRCGKIRRLTQPFSASCRLAPSRNGFEVLLVGNSYADSLKPVLQSEALKTGTGFHLMKDNCALGHGPCAVQNLLHEIATSHITHVILHSSPHSMEAGDVAALLTAAAQKNFQIILIDPTPVWAESVPSLLYKQQAHRVALPLQTVADYNVFNRDLLTGVNSLSSPFFREYKVAEFFCHPNCALQDQDGYPLYFDSGHLTLHGGEILRPLAQHIFSAIQ